MDARLIDLERRVAAMEETLHQERKPTFYAVAVGRERGIYSTSQQADAQTLRFPNGKQHMYHTMAEAEAFLAAHMELAPSTEPVWAVARGETPGVYHTPEQANKQTKGFKGSKQQRFTSMAAALAFVAEHQDPEPDPHPLFVVDREGTEGMDE
jgi:viroplasmin and RNaseH domain-containing protein